MWTWFRVTRVDRSGQNRAAQAFRHLHAQAIPADSRSQHTISDLNCRGIRMPRKRPHLARLDQVRISRNGEGAIIEFEDSGIPTTHLPRLLPFLRQQEHRLQR